MPLQPLKSSVHEAMHNYIPHFDRAGQHWTQMYDRLPGSSAVDNSACTGVTERVRGTLCTRMLMHKVMYMYFSWKLNWPHCSFVSNCTCSMFSFQLSPCIYVYRYVMHVMQCRHMYQSAVCCHVLQQLHPVTEIHHRSQSMHAWIIYVIRYCI